MAGEPRKRKPPKRVQIAYGVAASIASMASMAQRDDAVTRCRLIAQDAERIMRLLDPESAERELAHAR